MHIKDLRGLRFPEEQLVRFFFKSGLHQVPGRVLELGCGNGCNLRLFAEYGWTGDGIDLDVEDARHNFAELAGWSFHAHDLAEELPVGGPYDVAFCSQTLCVLPRETARQALASLKTRLKPGGLCYLRTRTTRDYRFRRGLEIDRHSFVLETNDTGEAGTLNTFYTESELVEMLHKLAGVTVERCLRNRWDNLQNGVVVTNDELVLWGRA